MGKFKDLILTELGNTTDGYDWRFNGVVDGRHGGEAEYNFYSDEIKYEVIFKSVSNGFSSVGDQIEVDFAPKSGEVQTGDYTSRYSVNTNQGNQFRIMATVLDITKHLWKNKNEIFDSDRDFSRLYFSPVGEGDSRKRAKLYKTFINRQFPNAEIEQNGSNFYVYP